MRTAHELCAAAGISRKALRVYREKELLVPVSRTASGYWLYEDSAEKTLRRIQLLKMLGFTLSEIRGLQEAAKEQMDMALQQKAREIRQRRDQLEQQISLIQSARDHLGRNGSLTGFPETAAGLRQNGSRQKRPAGGNHESR